MGLIHWKQIDGDLAGSRVLTGSLRISGSIEIEALNGVNSFTGSFSNSGSMINTGSFENIGNIINQGNFINSGAISNTGSFSIQSGSFEINLDGNEDYFSINVAGEEEVGVNAEGTFKLKPKAVTPSAVSGGLFYSGSDEYFLGFNN